MLASSRLRRAAWEAAMLTISLDRVIDLLDKAAEIELPDAEIETTADGITEEIVLDAQELADILADDPAYGALLEAVSRLTPDETDEILALALFARNALSLDEWQSVLEQARELPDDSTVGELVRTLLLTDELEVALERLGYLSGDEGDEAELDETEEEDEDESEEDEE
jgi:Protein of unknown function (DUF3775)